MGKVSFIIGDGLNTEFILHHNFGTMDVQFSARENKEEGFMVIPDFAVIDENNAKVSFGSPPAPQEYVATVFG